MFPGRLLPGIGHGVHDWMVQVDAAVASPMTLLREYAGTLRRLLAGERVDVAGRYVTLSGVALDWPPDPVPPLLIGAVGPRTLRLAAESIAAAVLAAGDAGATIVPLVVAGVGKPPLGATDRGLGAWVADVGVSVAARINEP